MTDNEIKCEKCFHKSVCEKKTCAECLGLYCDDCKLYDLYSGVPYIEDCEDFIDADLINRQQAEIEKLKDSRDRWKQNALSFDEASRETEKELEKLYAEIEEHKNKCDKCGAKTRACIESLQNNIAEKQAEIERLQSVLLCFIDEVSKWENKHGLDVSELPLIPIKGESEKITSQIKAEAIKEFANKLKAHMECWTYDFVDLSEQYAAFDKIDNLVKEMVGESNV